MPSAFQVIAADYDGTLTSGAMPDAVVLDAIAGARRDGRRFVLVTGRILVELRHAFPGVDEHFDAIVAENGAVLEEIHRLGLDCQVMYNRAALEVCELGVAVANAVPSLKERADVVLDEPAGAGVVSLLRGPILRGEQRVHPRRWQVQLGWHADGTVATIPASQLNVLVTGGSRAGKSYTGGLVAERLVLLGYSVLVIDVEGDHTGLGDLRDVLTFNASGLPSPDEVPRLLRHRFASVVLDLSSLAPEDQDSYVSEVAAEVRLNRADCGLPHWIVVDEAHRPFSASVPIFSDTSRKGYCLITWQPGHLPPETIDDLAGVLTRAEPGRALLSANPEATRTGLLQAIETRYVA